MSGKLHSLYTRAYISELLPIMTRYCDYHTQLAVQQVGEHQKAYRALKADGVSFITPTRKSATILVHALFKNTITSFLTYEKHGLNEQVIAEALFGEGVSVTPSVRYFIDDFLTVDEIDDITIEMDLQISNFLERGTWLIVDVFDMENSLSVVVSEDLRIREWKQMKGHITPCAAAVDLDLTQMLQYVKSTVSRQFAKVHLNIGQGQVMVKSLGDLIDFKPIILDMLVARYSFLRLEKQIGNLDNQHITIDPKNIGLLESAGIDPIRFRDVVVTLLRTLVENYAVCHYINRLEPTNLYEVIIDEDNHLRVVYIDDVVISVDDTSRVKELVESYLRGDYLPPKEREEAERYIQENQ